jgi:hypothetical protein
MQAHDGLDHLMRSIACFKRSLDALDASKSIIQAQMKELPREELHHLRTPSYTVYLIRADAPMMLRL